MRNNLFFEYIFHVFIDCGIIVDSSEFINIVSNNFEALTLSYYTILFNWISHNLHYTFKIVNLLLTKIHNIFLTHTVEDF